MKLKKVQCSGCGGPKVTEPKTAYIYCDYCGRYIDWDFYKSISTRGSKMSGPEWERLNTELAPELQAAQQAGDQEKYRDLQRRLFEVHIESCPASYSPRVGDPEYRRAMIEYMAEQYTLMAFTPELIKLGKKMDKAMAGLRWKTVAPEPKDLMERLSSGKEGALEMVNVISGIRKVESDSFFRLYESFKNNTDALYREAEKIALLERYPDPISPEQLFRTSASIFVEAWMPYLEEEDKQRLLDETGLEGEYLEVAEPATTERHCGVCGNPLAVVEKARQVVCEECGHTINVAGSEIPCESCGVSVSVPAGKRHFHCPYCESGIRVAF